MAQDMGETPDTKDRIRLLEHQNSVILFLSAGNMFVNVVTILLAALVAWG